MSEQTSTRDWRDAALARYERILQTILDEEGRVCGDWATGCAHPGCRSSWHSWLLADEALHPPTLVRALAEAA